MERNGRDVGGYRVKGYTGWWGYTGSSVTEGETWCQGSAGKKPMEVSPEVPSGLEASLTLPPPTQPTGCV